MMYINLIYDRCIVVKQSCYCAKICDREFTKKHIVVNLFSLQLLVDE